MRGILTVIEGLDGSGKGTQTELLAEHIGQVSNDSAVVTHYPTYEKTPLGELILEMLKGDTVILDRKKLSSKMLYSTPQELFEGIGGWLSESKHELNPLALQALFAADRYQLDTKTRRLLEMGMHLVYDRYYHSSLVYGEATGVDPKFLQAINESVAQPDLAIFLDVTPEESVRRRPERRDRFEKDPDLMHQVLMGYRKLWVERNVKGLNYHILDGERDPEVIHANIITLWERTQRSR